MSETTLVAQQAFVNKDGIIKDLLNEFSKEEPSVEITQLKRDLAIEQECDLQADFLAALKDRDDESLSNYIRMYVRDNSNDVTEMPAAVKYLFTSTDQEPDQAFTLVGETNTQQKSLEFKERLEPFDFYGSKSPSWEEQEGWIFFKERINILLNYEFVLQLSLGDQSTDNINWRLSNTGTNRMVSVHPILELKGRFTNGNQTVMQLPGILFYPEDLVQKDIAVVSSSLSLEIKNPNYSGGYIESIRMGLSRGPWVASRNNNTTTIKDRVSILKKTVKGQPDIHNNYMEIIEL